MVVNNNAAAVLLVLAALAAGRDVPVSRGESVEIGGGFRVPEVMEQSGARLRRRRHDEPHPPRRLPPGDRRAGADVALVLKVHPSNYRVDGFVEDDVGRRAGESSACPSWPTSAVGWSTPTCPWLAGALRRRGSAGEPAAARRWRPAPRW